MGNFFTKPIFTSILPTIQRDDLWLTLKLFFQPWRWRNGKGPEEFKKALQNHFGRQNIFLFDSGRSALYAILLSLNLKEGDEVLIQSFTCTAAVGPILWAKARPVYVDISPENYNMLPEDLARKITPRSRAVIIQHTFGLAAPINELLKIARKHNLVVIEDVAHALGGRYQGKWLGTLGEAAIFSFGRSKIVSACSGGAALVNDQTIADNLTAFYRSCRQPSLFWIKRQLLHTIIFSLVKTCYNFFYLGRAVAVLAKAWRLYIPSVSQSEKRGGRPPWGPNLMPNVLAKLGLHQFRKLDDFNEHRKNLVKVYWKELCREKKLSLPLQLKKKACPLWYLPVAFENAFVAEEFLKRAKLAGIYLDVWPARIVIGPSGTNLSKFYYSAGSCPNAESLALRSVVLPVNPLLSYEEVLRIVNLIRSYLAGDRPPLYLSETNKRLSG